MPDLNFPVAEAYRVTIDNIPAALVEKLLRVQELERLGWLKWDQTTKAYVAISMLPGMPAPEPNTSLPTTGVGWVKLFLFRSITAGYEIAKPVMEKLEAAQFEAALLTEQDTIGLSIEPATGAGGEGIVTQ